MSDIKGNLVQTAFTSGIWSNILAGRTDFNEYATALQDLQNFVIWPQGAVSYRSGFKFIAGAKFFNKDAILIPFVFSVSEAYVIEAGDEYFRFFQDKQPLLLNGAPYEVVSPYTDADLQEISWCQSADVLYLFHKNHRPRKLMRLGQTSWVLESINWYPPPTTETPIKPQMVLTLAAITGNNIAFSVPSYFIAGDVGRLIKAGTGRASIITVTDASHIVCDIISAFDTTSYSAGDWELQGSPNAALLPSIKEPKDAICTLTSTANLFRTEDLNKYIRINSGLILITQIVSAQTIKGQILQILSSMDSATNWTLETEMWNGTDGYPRTGTFFEERLTVAGSVNYPGTVWGSVVGDYENFAPGINDSDSFQVTILSRKVNTIKWLASGDYLVVGTSSSEWRLGPENTGDPLTPLNVVAKEVTSKGCAQISPLEIDGSILFVQRAKRKLRELTYDFARGESGGFSAPDLTQLAEHLTKGGISCMSYQQEPFSTIWIVINKTLLITLTYQRDAKIVAWGKHPLREGDAVEYVCCIPGENSDEVWVLTYRMINGQAVKYIESMESLFTDTAEEFTNNKGLNAFFMDAGISYNGADITTLTGLTHLEGETVNVLANGSATAPKLVTNGQVTLDNPAGVVHAGLPYSGILKTLRMNAQLPDGTMQAREKRIINVFVRVKDSGPFSTGRDLSHVDLVQNTDQNLTYGAPFLLFSGDLQTHYEGEYDKAGQLYINQTNPLPLTIQAIYPEVETS